MNLLRVFSLSFLLLAFWPWAAQAGVKIEHWTTPSGAQVYFVASPALPILDVRIDFSAGSAYEPAGKAGLASLTTHLLDTGVGAGLGQNGLNEEQVAEKLADIAAQLSASVDNDRAGISLRTLVAPREREAALDLMHALLAAPEFPEEVLVREKKRTIAAIQEADTHPDALAAKRFMQAIYPGHPYGVSATVDSVAALTRADVVTYWRTHFGAQRAVVSIIGDVSRAEAEALAARLTSGLPEVAPAEALPVVHLPQAAVLKLPHPAMQSHIHIGLPAIRRDDADFFPLLVGNYVLGGGGFVSRLMKEVREKRGYAYSVYSYFDPHLLEGPFEIGLQTRRTQAAEAVRVVEDTLTGFLRDGPTAGELKAAKQNLVDGLALKIDSNAKILGYLAVIGFYHLPLDYLDRYAERVEAVTAAQVRAAFARHVVPAHMVTLMVAAD
ncbi:MAG: insulinase family protein [Sterolibacterium sp.]|nr:insulinase family protein [Sterolibacterium sp.]MBP9800505.1 insulinase family protein [Sterolibacterium sp.]